MIQDRRKQYQSKRKTKWYPINCGCETSEGISDKIGGLKSVSHTIPAPTDNTSNWMKMINEAEWQLWNLDADGNYKEIK